MSDKVEKFLKDKQRQKRAKDVMETASILTGAGLGAAGGLKLPLNTKSTIANVVVPVVGGLSGGAFLGSRVIDIKKPRPTENDARKAAGTIGGQIMVPIPGVGGHLGKELVEKKAAKKEEIKPETLGLAGGSAASAAGGAAAIARSNKGVKGAKPKGDIKYVIAGPVSPNKRIMGAETTTLDKLKVGPKTNKNLVGILGGKTVYDKKYNVPLGSYTTGQVFADYKETQDVIEDKWKFYDAHKNKSYMPKTLRADQIKSEADLKKAFGDTGYIAKKRVAYAGRGVLTQEGNEKQLGNINKSRKEVGKKPISKMRDLIGDKDYIFQEKLDLDDYAKSEYRVTAANNMALDVIPRDSKGELNYARSRASLKASDARKFEEVRDFAQKYVDEALPVNKGGVHALDVVQDRKGRMYIVESNAAGGANIRAGSGRNVAKAYKEGIKPRSYSSKIKLRRLGAAGAAGSLALGAGALYAQNQDKIKK